MSSSLFDKRLVVIAGKGGVGRTTVAAALAVAAARQGRRVLLCQTRSKERLPHLLNVPAVGPELTRVRDRLWAVNMTPQAALREYGAMVLRSLFLSRQVLENRISRAFLHAVPGLEDYALLGKVWYHTTEEDAPGQPRWELVILDGPATGHLISMLRVPRVILEAVPEGPLTRSAASARRLLEDPVRSAMLLVTLAEDLPTHEAIELAEQARQHVGISLAALVVNAIYPPRFGQGPSARAMAAFPERLDDPVLDPLLASARTVLRRRQLNDHYIAQLRRDLPLPQVHLPYLFQPDFGVESIEDLSRRLESHLLVVAAA